MKLVVLGSAGYHANDFRQTTCVLIPEHGIVFDAGTSFFRLPDYLKTKEIDVFLSHAHLDHVVGLTHLISVQYRYELESVRVHGDASKLQAIRKHLFAKELFPVEPSYEEIPLTQGEVHVGSGNGKVSGRVTWIELDHPGKSIGYRVDWPDRSLAFITDTTADPNAEYVEFIRDVDLLVHECNFPDGMEEFAKKTGHSCLSATAEVAKAANVGGLVLIHFDPLRRLETEEDAMKRAEAIFSPIVYAEDGMEIEL